MNTRIACVIVTYNRKSLLKCCLEAVAAQDFKPVAVFITDNASTDGTMDSVKEWGYYECKRNGIIFKYVLNSKNEGGAGGFYLGIKTAYEDGGYDGVWVMDDDGAPAKDCLKQLVNYLPERDYISPFVLSIENPEEGFGLAHPKYKDVLAKYPSGVLEGGAAPFNGILYSFHLIKKIGFPKREMFIWGDETNYHLRAIKAGMTPVTILTARHYHPSTRQVVFCYGKNIYVDVVAPWKLYCFLRNKWYNTLRYSNHNVVRSSLSVVWDLLNYNRAYRTIKKTNILSLSIDALLCAFMGKFDRLYRYRNS